MVKKKCIYCGNVRALEEEHIKPKSKGGTTTAYACKRCNRSKSDDTYLAWFRRLKKNRDSLWYKIKKYQKGKRGKIAETARKVANE